MDKDKVFFVVCIVFSAAMVGVMVGSAFFGETKTVVEWRERIITKTPINIPLPSPEENRITDMVLHGAYPYDGRTDTKAWGRLDEFRVGQTCFGKKYLFYIEHKTFTGFACEDD